LAHLSEEKILYDDRRSHRGYLDNRLDAPRSSHHAPPLTGNLQRIVAKGNSAIANTKAYVI
jgi:hypothetical protein